VPVPKMGNTANRQALYQQFAEGGVEEVSIPALWWKINQLELDALGNVPIEIGDTVYGRFKE
jgi:hypothetical protein